MKKYVVIVAGGSGTRMGADVPKQFLLLAGKPILMHTISTFYSFDNSIAINLVLPENQISYWSQLCEDHKFTIKHTIIAGGNARFFSVKNGLVNVSDKAIVAIHDGVRPFVSHQTLERCFNMAEELGNAIPVMPVVESLRTLKDSTSFCVDRSLFRTVQTPQVFRADLLHDAYDVPFSDYFTDDASVVEKAGIEINLVEGNLENIKITTPFDLRIGELLLSKNS